MQAAGKRRMRMRGHRGHAPFTGAHEHIADTAALSRELTTVSYSARIWLREHFIRKTESSQTCKLKQESGRH
jgi:hypothetical protein